MAYRTAHNDKTTGECKNREMDADLADEVCSIVAQGIAKCAKDVRMRPHAASTAHHLGDGVLPVSTLVTVDTKVAKKLRNKITPPPSPSGASDERPPPSILDMVLSIRDAVSRVGKGTVYRQAIPRVTQNNDCYFFVMII